ncbi:pectinesterase family protein [Butyrivibrio sp. AE2032]|uniref:pectinesterase family protein n=1 Tax=Butyrivibrio sp. AE2032 TaxID=1458463 RepID=UPI0005518506|nr:pectinesterase family protein [Butyrivibrio sp. AE2032]
MVKRTKRGKTGAKVFAAIMSVVLGLSNVPGAMSGAMAYAETGEANDAQVTEGAGEQASSVASTDGAASEGSSVSTEGEEQKKSSGAEEKQETPGEDSLSTGSGSEDSAKGEESGDANEKSNGTGSSDKDEKSNSSDEASSEKTETVEKSDEKDAEATGKKSSEKTADAASEYSTYDPSSSSRDFDYNKTDVWDFGAEDLGDEYNNRLDVDTINGFYDGVEPGSTGKNIASFSVDDGDFVFNDGGNSNTHKLRTINSALTHADEKSLKDSDGNVYSGYLYSNKSSNESVYLALECQADDIITAYVSRNNGDSEIHFVNMSDSSDDTSYTHTLGSSMVSKFVCYPSQTAKYKFYSANEKLVVARVTREHASYANLTGTVIGFTGTDSFDVVFTNTKNGNEVKATVVDGKYTAELACGFDYELSLEGADEYVITTDKTVNISDDAEMNIEVSSVDLVEVSGTVKGIAEDAVDKFIDGAEFTFKAQDENSVFVPVINLKKVGSDIEFETRLQKNVTYDVSVADKEQVAVVEDYDLLTTEFKADDAAIEFEAKPVYKVTIVPEGASKEDLAEAVFTFTRLDVEKEFVPDGYVYEFTGLNDIVLRDGQYVVKVTNSGAFVQRLTSNLIVKGANVSKTINFSSDITEWDFSDAAFTAKFANVTEGNYNGLSWTNGRSHNNTYLYSGAGKISVPVKGACQIKVTANYQYSYYFENDAEKSVNVLTESTSQNDTFTYDYKGEAGTFDITVLGTSYITKIATVYQTEYKKELLVGSSDKADFATIGEALEAVRIMNREDGERVTINIEPGNYEEMLVVDVPDVTLANASSVPTNTLTDSGVGIDGNAVRITWYYGHGYSYYSMGSDYKYDAEVLAANKANGYASVANPGSGTGTYWNASVVVNASGFEAKNIIFENSFNQYQSQKAAEDVIVPNSGAKEGTVARASMAAGDTTVQEKKYVERAAALALTASAKEAYFEGCRIVGRQDTLYGAVGTTAAFYNCAVYGGTDYIFGGMTAVFAKCDLVLNTSEDKNDVAYITAAQQQSASSRGYLMYNCTVKSTTPGVDTASAHTSKPGQFGRPWQANTSEAVFFDTVVEATNWTLGADGKYTYDKSSEVSLIQPEGWNTTLGGESARNVEYGTFEVAKVDNSSSRVSWVQQPKDAVLADGTAISVAAFLGEWDPFTANNDDMTITFPDGTSQDAPEAPAAGTASETSEFVFEASGLEGFTAGKKDGDTQKVGTDDYFTLVFSAKSKVDASSKEWEDGYKSGQRVNFGGKAATDKNALKFITSNSATVKIWWAEGGEDNRQMAILNGKGEVAAITEGTYAKNSPYISTLKLKEAGTYYLGGDINNNYIFKVVVTEDKAAEPVVSTLESLALEKFAAGNKKDGDTEKAGTNGYFTLVYSEKSKVDDSSKKWEDGYESGRRVNFGGAVSTEKNAIKFTTSADNASVKVWWAEGGDDNRQVAILDSTGKVAAKTEGTYVKNSPYISTLTLEKAGTYYLGGDINNNYFFKVEVTDGAPVEVKRADWSEVKAPEITDVSINDENKIVVKVSSLIGKDGGDTLVVTMYDEQGMEKGTSKSLQEVEEFAFTFAPERTGKYYFTATLSRDDVEEVKTSDKSKEISFTYELKAPAFKNATNKGNGSVTVKFYSVSEADDYVLTYIDTENEKSSKSARITPKEVVYNTSTEYAYTFDGLTVGHKYNFELVAKRGQETSEVSVLQGFTVTKESGIEWTFAAFGSGVSTSSTNCGYETYDNGSVTVWNTGNKGKIVPASTDGLSFFYATLPADKNFTFTATATIDTWAFTNGQEGFGLMACDRVGVNGDASVFWNNSYMASGTKVEYYYDKEKGESTFDETDSKITMKLGLGAQQKIGVTQENLDLLEANDTETINNDFSSKMYPLEISCGTKGTGTYNLFGKESSGTVQGTVDNTLTKVRLRIQKNNTGYFVSYLDENDNELCTRKFYDTEALSKLDPDHVYVGFYASRTFKATFSDIEIVRTNPEDDAPAEDRDITYVAPNYKIVSATYSNTAKYDLSYSGNADGTLTISDENGNVLVNAQEVTANETVTVTTKLARGDNKFNVKFIPSEFFFPEGDQYKRLSSYEMSEFTHTVKFETINDSDSVYVSADGKAGADGTKENPVDIYTAVKYVQPGQTIRLAAGTYSLSSTVKVERGIDGTPSKPIKMVAEDGRAIFDFNKSCAGFIFAGDYWYVNGIDCTKSGNSLKGIQVSGSHITLEDVRTYENGNTGIQVSRYLGSDDRDEWPSYDLILNCTSYSNADAGYEDADGFAAKLTVGEGVVFDGCIAYNNADDGWDLFAKVETGSIGQVTIRNCVAFANGYGVDGKEEGNGNGFKMGGSSINGPHKLINSVAWGNKAKGIDSNSGPDIQVYNSMSFNNGSNNVALYTNDTANTDYLVDGVISFRTTGESTNENIKAKGTQDKSKIYGKKNFFWQDGKSTNSEGLAVTSDWFVSLDAPYANSSDPYAVAASLRTSNGSIDLGDFMKLTDKAIEAMSAAGLSASEVAANIGGDYEAVTDERNIAGSADDAKNDEESEEENSGSGEAGSGSSTSGSTSGSTSENTSGSSSSGSGSGSGSGSSESSDGTGSESGSSSESTSAASSASSSSTTGATIPTGEVAQTGTTVTGQTNTPVVAGATRENGTSSDNGTGSSEGTQSDNGSSNEAAQADSSATQENAQQDNSAATENAAVDNGSDKTIVDEQAPKSDKPERKVPVAPIAGGTVVVVAAAAIAVKTGLMAKLLAFLHIIK